MSSEENMFNMYRSILNTLHNQYGRTLETMESIEYGMRQTILRSNHFDQRHPAEEYRARSSSQFPLFTDNNPVPLSSHPVFTRSANNMNMNNAHNTHNNSHSRGNVTRSTPMPMNVNLNSTRNTRSRTRTRSGGNSYSHTQQENTHPTPLSANDLISSIFGNDNMEGNGTSNLFTVSSPTLTSF